MYKVYSNDFLIGFQKCIVEEESPLRGIWVVNLISSCGLSQVFIVFIDEFGWSTSSIGIKLNTLLIISVTVARSLCS